MKNGLHVEYGVKKWYRDDKLHREDGPAIESESGRKEWYLNGERHREDGPAVESEEGGKAWYINGKLHREDGPAVENMTLDSYDGGDGTQEESLFLIDLEGEFSWYLNGELHREDGPAVEKSNAIYNEWWIHGRELSKDEVNMRLDGASEEDLDLMHLLGLLEGKILDYRSFKKYI